FIRYSDQEPVQKVLYVGISNNRILCVQCSTGQILSEFKTGSSIEATPVCDGATVMAGAKDGNFYGLHFFAWGQKPYVFFKQNTEHQLTSSAILDQTGCRVIYEGKQGWIYSFKNSLQWSLKIDESMRSSPILINCSQSQMIFAGSDSGIFSMIDAKTGKLLWSEKLTGSVVASPSVFDNGFVCVLVATTDHRLSCFGQRPKYPDDW
ncbi:MAG TPA: PQQ-binding-like beta-propeller repeat protein, partial [Caldisericia bacterium]|nr:PQQ-binding-like beta-propeller repeat protein [Caldisericia bacterium]